MLLQLCINKVLIVDSVVIDLSSGFSIFTGETGAGKSIMLDSLVFVTGGKIPSNYTEKSEVIAKFDISYNIALKEKFNDDILVLKRTKRCFVNDKAVSLSNLRELGKDLIEFHGQHSDRLLLQKVKHLRLLDEFGNIDTIKLAQLYANWLMAQRNLEQQAKAIELSLQERDYLQNAYEELTSLNVQIDEEEFLTSKRTLLLKQQKFFNLILEVKQALTKENSPSSILTELWRKLDRNAAVGDTKPLLDEIDSILNMLAIFEDNVNESLNNLIFDEHELEIIEERLFALRSAARKYDELVINLPTLYEKIAQKINLIENAELAFEEAQQKLDDCKEAYMHEAKRISALRQQAAQKLAEQVRLELPDLKLEHANFFVKLEKADMSKLGLDKVEFWVQTNPNTRAGPILEIASGGELSRFILALKLVLFNKAKIATLIFDEIDTGVGGAVATAIGKKLKKLSEYAQLIAITHLPQVAALADHQFLISKYFIAGERRLTSTISKLNNVERIEELARMLSGNEITDEARASAKSLLTKI